MNSILTSLGSKENKLEVIHRDSKFLIAGDKSEYAESIFEDENVLIILRGYVLYEAIDYGLNIAKQLLQFYRLNGPDIFKELSGAYNVIIFEKEKQKLTITNDRLGMKPLYYYSDKDKFIFASDIKTIALSNQIKKEINWRAWGDIFNYGFIVGNETPFENILPLPMSSILTYEKGNLEIKEYWSFNQVKIDYKQSEKETIEKGVEILKNITKKYEKFVKYVELPLSGGYDSRCIACCLKYFSEIKFDTITSNLHGTGDRDSIIAKELAKKLEVENVQTSDNDLHKKYFLEMVYLVNGMTFGHLWAMSLSYNSKKNTSLFNGITADVILRLKSRIIKRDLKSKIYEDKVLVKFFINDVEFVSSNLREYFSTEIKKQMTVEEDAFLRQIKKIKEYKHKLTFLFLNNRTRNSLAIGANNILGFGKRVYLFFSDNDFIDFCLAIPPKYKIKRDIYFEILEKAFPQIMSIQSTNDSLLLKKFKKKIINSLKVLLIDDNLIKIFSFAGIDLKKYKKFKFLSKFSAFPLNKEDEKYLQGLIKKLDFPSELNKDLFFEQVEKEILKGEKMDHILIPIANFVVWYNLFYLGKSLDYLKSL
jgi:hypothetical protein